MLSLFLRGRPFPLPTSFFSLPSAIFFVILHSFENSNIPRPIPPPIPWGSCPLKSDGDSPPNSIIMIMITAVSASQA